MAEVDDEELHDGYLDVALRGEASDPETFCQERGVDTDGLEVLLLP